MSHGRMLLSCAILLVALLGCSDEHPGRAPARGDAAAVATPVPAVTSVDGARIAAADDEPHNWLSHGRSYSEQRFSPLGPIDAANCPGRTRPVRWMSFSGRTIADGRLLRGGSMAPAIAAIDG